MTRQQTNKLTSTTAFKYLQKYNFRHSHRLTVIINFYRNRFIKTWIIALWLAEIKTRGMSLVPCHRKTMFPQKDAKLHPKKAQTVRRRGTQPQEMPRHYGLKEVRGPATGQLHWLLNANVRPSKLIINNRGHVRRSQASPRRRRALLRSTLVSNL